MKKHNFLGFLKGKLLIKLWCAFMALVLLAMGAMWLVQVQLFEPTYIEASITDLRNRTVDAIAELNELGEIDPESNENSLFYLSKSIRGKVYLVDENGKVLFGYNRALITDPQEIQVDKDFFIENNYRTVLGGSSLGNTLESTHGTPLLVVGERLTYQSRPAAVILYSNVIELDALIELNRRQLILLTCILALAASVIAFVLAKTFTKPILNIQQTVDEMAKGDFTAVPDVHRSDELGSLSDSVRVLSTELQRIDVLRKEVIANVSHELRSPLALITGYGEMVRDVNGADEALRKRNMDLILRESRRLSEMVDDIMDYSQLQSGYAQLKLDVYNLYELVETAAEYGAEVGREYEISVVFESDSRDIPVYVDALKITQVLRNLLNNAINHTENGETIRVEIRQPEEKDRGRVSVTNPGAPIAPEEARMIWERYKQIQHQGGRREGTGIGLSIVSAILKAHGLDYGVTSEQGENCFWFTFVCEERPPENLP